MFPAAKRRNTTPTPRQKNIHYHSVTNWFIKKTNIVIKLLSYKLILYRWVVSPTSILRLANMRGLVPATSPCN